ncbi:DnaJ-like protein subfamily B member 8 [Nymphaea thermarum]|nr:DnaJ-like protein subfamily B member 8 [Nymphaea thermarum]
MADYYVELGVSHNASPEEIRSAYRKQAVRWHPDKWTRVPAGAEEAKKKFQNVQEAYSVLSDGRKRTLYNAGLYDPSEQVDEGLCDFAQEMFSLMAQVRNEVISPPHSAKPTIVCPLVWNGMDALSFELLKEPSIVVGCLQKKRYGLGELQDMLGQMMEDQALCGGWFEAPTEASGASKRARDPGQESCQRAVKGRAGGFAQWHPDKCRRVPPELAEEAKKKFQNIQEAYSVLSDGRKRKWYNAGLYDPSEQEDEVNSSSIEIKLALFCNS